jgi:hypothetical protein
MLSINASCRVYGEISADGKKGTKESSTVVSIDQLDAFFTQLCTNTTDLLPDGILNINIKSLHSLKLLDECPPPGTMALHTIESDEKITLFNDNFALWIAPQKNASPAETVVFIARTAEGKFIPEVAFRTRGLHNQSKTIIRIIDRLLSDITETDSVISELENRPCADQ